MKPRAKKIFGQHFLNNKAVVERILDAFAPGNLPVLEIGPGLGVLSFDLLEKYGERYKAIEVDTDMIEYLRKENPFIQKHILHKDFLKANPDEIWKEPFAIIGNFPYNISSQIVFKVIESEVEIPLLVGMFQKEMAQRIVADEGSKTYGVISVLTALFYNRAYLFDIAPGNFSPPPKVMSGIIRLERQPMDLGEMNYAAVKKVVKMAFSQRRKTMRNSLKPMIKANDIDSGLEIFNYRPEQLSPQNFIELTHKLMLK